jgi:enamine deaminase RidA (YjgF/YER057c/UK114 family)
MPTCRTRPEFGSAIISSCPGWGRWTRLTGGRNLGPIAEQVRQTLRKMAHILESAGSGLDRIVKMTVVLADARDYDEMNRYGANSSRATRPHGPPAHCSSATATASKSNASLSLRKARLSDETGADWSC